MDLFNRKNILMRRHAQTAVCTYLDVERQESIADVFIRNHHGIHFLRKPSSGSLPESATLYYETYRLGIYSPRPYHLHLPSDDSVFYSVLSLTVACCQAWNLEAGELIQCADPAAQVTGAELLAVKDLARWQDTVFPAQWNTETIAALKQALADVGCGVLGSRLFERTVRARGY